MAHLVSVAAPQFRAIAAEFASCLSGKYVDDNLTTPLAAGLVAALILGV